VPYSEISELTLDEALARGRAARPDYLSAHARVRAAELAKQSAAARNYPAVTIDANYGAIGTRFNSSQSTVTFVGALVVPLFQGTSVRADVLQADTVLRQARAAREDLGAAIDYDIRTAFLNLSSARQLVAVARSSVDLAAQALGLARDRLNAGVTNYLEVVDAQQSIARANESYITSVYAYNAAKVALAHAIGSAEQSTLSDLGVK
jgi:outer membrane protein TolC